MATMNRYRYPNYQRPPFDDHLRIGERWVRNSNNRDEIEPPLLGAVTIYTFTGNKELQTIALKEIDGKDPNYTQIMLMQHFLEYYEPL